MLTNLKKKPDFSKRVLIFGGSGFVGGELTKKLNDSNIKNISLNSKDINLFEKNSKEKIKKILKKNDTVVFVSAKAPCKNYSDFMQNLEMINFFSEKNKFTDLIEHFIYISSDAVYKDTKSKINESSIVEPNSFHGMMHVSRELFLEATFSNRFTSIRPTLIYGTNDPHNGYGPNQFRRKCIDGENIELFGNGEELRDHVYIEDVAELIKLVIVHKSIGLINSTSGEVNSFYDIAKKTTSLFNNNISINSNPRIGDMPHLGLRQFDNSQIHKAFPNFKVTNFSDGLTKTYNEKNS